MPAFCVQEGHGKLPGLMARQMSSALQVFCEEAKGRETYYRRFVAASYDALWTRFAKLPPSGRHFYEACPCLMAAELVDARIHILDAGMPSAV